MDAEQISFQCDAGSGEQSVSLSGSFTPNLILFSSVNSNATEGTGLACDHSFGAATGVSGAETVSIANSCDHGVLTSAAGRRMATDRFLINCTNTGGSDRAFDVTSFDSGGFTIDHLGNDATNIYVSALCLNVPDAKVGTFTAPASATTKAVTGVGFQPDLIILFSMASGSIDAAVDDVAYHFGAGDGSNQFSICGGSPDNVGSPGAAANSYHSNSKIVYVLPSGGSTTSEMEATLDSLDSDGFTLDFTKTVSGRYFGYIAIKDGNSAVSTAYTHATSTGTQAVTGAGFTPKALIHFCTSAATLNTNDTQFKPSVGFATGTGSTDQGNMNARVKDSSYPSSTSHASRNTATVQTTKDDGTQQSLARVSSYDSDGHTWNWLIAHSTGLYGNTIWLGEEPDDGSTLTFYMPPSEPVPRKIDSAGY